MRSTRQACIVSRVRCTPSRRTIRFLTTRSERPMRGPISSGTRYPRIQTPRPGIYRPRDAADTMDPEATIAPARPASTQPWRPGAGAASAAPQALFGPDSADGPQGGPPPLAVTAQVQGGGLAWGGGRAVGRASAPRPR